MLETGGRKSTFRCNMIKKCGGWPNIMKKFYWPTKNGWWIKWNAIPRFSMNLYKCTCLPLIIWLRLTISSRLLSTCSQKATFSRLTSTTISKLLLFFRIKSLWYQLSTPINSWFYAEGYFSLSSSNSPFRPN